MRYEKISVGASVEYNEDHIVVFEHKGVTDIIVFDGGTSVASCNYIDSEVGDVVWFIRCVSSAIEVAIMSGSNQVDAINYAVDVANKEFYSRAGSRDIPRYALPISALTWVRITQKNNNTRLQLYSLGDCTTLLAFPDGKVVDIDPYENPQETILQDEISHLRVSGISDLTEIRSRIMPMLRSRREHQNNMLLPSVLCLQPGHGFDSRLHDVNIPQDTILLVMTDGFYRLVNVYGIFTHVSLMQMCVHEGLNVAIDTLRSHERGQGIWSTAKRGDDASVLLAYIS